MFLTANNSLQPITLLISIIGILVSGASMLISAMIYRRTITQEKQNLSVKVLNTFNSAVTQVEFVYVDLLFINKSKLPISIIEANLKLLGKSVLRPELNNLTFTGMFERVRFSYMTERNSQGNHEVISEQFSDSLPFNISPLSTIEFTLAIKTGGLRVTTLENEKPVLTLKTTGNPIHISTQELVQSRIELSQRLKDSYLR